MIEYFTTDDEDIVQKIDTGSENIDLSVLVQEYLDLKTEYQALPEIKDIPDEETLDFWNEIKMIDRAGGEVDIKEKASILLEKIKPIYEAGLLPDKYKDEYQQLINFVS